MVDLNQKVGLRFSSLTLVIKKLAQNRFIPQPRLVAFCFHVYAAVGERTFLVEWGSKILWVTDYFFERKLATWHQKEIRSCFVLCILPSILCSFFMALKTCKSKFQYGVPFSFQLHVNRKINVQMTILFSTKCNQKHRLLHLLRKFPMLGCTHLPQFWNGHFTLCTRGLFDLSP